MSTPTSPNAAIATPDFFLSEPRQRSGDEYYRSLIFDDALRAKVWSSVESAGERAEALYSVVTQLSADRVDWESAGYRAHVEDPYRSAILGTLAVAGTDTDVARIFTDLLKSNPADLPVESPLHDKAFRSTCFKRAWNGRDHDPVAVALLFETLLSDFSQEEAASILNARYQTILRDGGDTASAGLVKFDQALKAMLDLAIPADIANGIERAHHSLANFVAEQKENQRRSSILDEAKTIRQTLGREPRRIADLDNFVVVTEAIGEFDTCLAIATLLDGVDAIARGYDDEIARHAEAIADRQLELFKDIDFGEGDKTPQNVAARRAVADVLTRRSLQAFETVESFVRVDEARLAELAEQARDLGVKFDASDARRHLVEYTIPPRQRDVDARLLAGVGPEVLPAPVLSVSAVCGRAHLRYESVDELIKDIEFHFVYGGRSPEDTDTGVAKALGRDDAPIPRHLTQNEAELIATSLVEELRAWHVDKSKEQFQHSQDDGYGTPYKYSGSAFTGNRFVANHDADGAILFSLTSGGYGGLDQNDPSSQLLPFASAVGKRAQVCYESMPTLVFAVAPTGDQLNTWAAEPFASYEQEPSSGRSGHAPPKVRVFKHHRLVVDSQELVNVVSAVMGLAPNAVQTIGITPDEAYALTRSIVDKPHPDADHDLHSMSGEVFVRVSDGYRDLRTVVKPGGSIAIPLDAVWEFPEAVDEGSPSLRVHTVSVGVTVNSEAAGLTASEATSRAKAFAHVISSARSPESHPDAPEWSGRYYSGEVTLRLPVDRMSDSLAAEVNDFVSEQALKVSSQGVEQRLFLSSSEFGSLEF